MLQRNVSGSPLVLPTLDPATEVLPGDMIDHPKLLAGFEAVTGEQTSIVDDQTEQDHEEAASSATTDEEVE